METRTVAILIFDGVELLDFCGPFEVFSTLDRDREVPRFEVFAIAETAEPVRARNGLEVIPARCFADEPRIDVLIVPGGIGTRRELGNARLIEWIRKTSGSAELTLSVCTGALLLAQAGLLQGLKVTTHFKALDLLREIAPGAEVLPERRYVDNGDIVLSAGISAGMDMSFHVIARLHGEDAAEEAARHMEYDWRREPQESF